VQFASHGICGGVPLGNVEITLTEIYKVFNVIKKLRENQLVLGDIKLDNFIVDCNDKVFLLDCMKRNGSLEQALDYGLMSAIYCLTYKYDASSIFKVSQQFFREWKFQTHLSSCI
jgi:hypothetical protein